MHGHLHQFRVLTISKKKLGHSRTDTSRVFFVGDAMTRSIDRCGSGSCPGPVADTHAQTHASARVLTI
jgi:hypothetical protein